MGFSIIWMVTDSPLMKYTLSRKIQEKNEFSTNVGADFSAGSKSKWYFFAWATPAEWKSFSYADAKSKCSSYYTQYGVWACESSQNYFTKDVRYCISCIFSFDLKINEGRYFFLNWCNFFWTWSTKENIIFSSK